MTLLAAVILPDRILIAADSREDRAANRLDDDAPTQHVVTKVHRVPNLPSVAWGTAGGSTLRVDLDVWFDEQTPTKWADLQVGAHNKLVTLKNEYADDLRMDPRDTGLDTRVMFAGWVGDKPKIHVSYSSGFKNATQTQHDFMFCGSGECSTRLALGIMKELHPETTVETSKGLRSFMRGCIAANPELGGKAMVWQIPKDGTLTLIDESED